MKKKLVLCAASLMVAALPFLVGVVLSGCATFKHIMRSVDDIATAACELFGQRNPEEFAELVRSVAPAQASRAEQDGFNPRVLCNIKQVVQPFIDDQLRLQNETKAELRARIQKGGTDANPSP